MNLSIAEVLELIISSVWRRWRLILAPILVFSMLAVLAVFAWPRTYATQTLLMLQENGPSDPLSGGGGASRMGRLKAEEIDTLLKSERVLAGSVLDFNAGRKALSPRDLEGEIRSLRKRISVSVVGNDFIEIALKDSARVGIGDRLSNIMTRFFERLLEREDSLTTARVFALQQRQRDVAQMSVMIEDWTKRANAAAPSAAAKDAKLADLRKKFGEMEEKLKLSTTNQMSRDVNMVLLDQVIDDEVRLSSTRKRTSDSPVSSTERTSMLKGLKAEYSSYRALSVQISDLMIGNARALARSLKTAVPSPDGSAKELLNEWDRIDARYMEAVEQFDKHIQRARKGSGPSMVPFGLIAPDSIRIIDEPRDPESPTTSLLKILLACLAAGIGMGLGLAALAEQLDDRIYDDRGLAKLTGSDDVFRVPLIATDLAANDSIDRASQDPSAAFRGHRPSASRT